MGAEKFARCHGGEESVESTGLDHTQIVISAAEHVAVVGYAKSSSYSGCMDVLCTGDGSNSDFNSSAKTFRANF
jgi:hypothetical protein